MTEGLYCKAYLGSQFREFADWVDSGLTVKEDLDDPETSIRPVNDDDVLFLHEDLSVTDGLFSEAQTIFVSDSEDWRKFCEETLEFSVPAEVEEARSAAALDLQPAGE